ncbi:hypothetical protein AYK24_02660 [Thermoplasmatales archaeon SG8-52-4]|nr:MAG: hypothetical protein AYK24_02660 [Thermoplasmatales archaeon SG8-52-4]
MDLEEKIKEENKKLRHLRLMIDLSIQLLYQQKNLSLSEGFKYIALARNYAISLFPDKGEVFDIVYKPRLMRVLEERNLISYSAN